MPDEITAFVMMPFAGEFDDVHDVIKRCVAEVDDSITTVRLDEVRAAGRITDDMVDRLNRSTLCIADVTGSNPNVMWEVGYAAARLKPTIAIKQGGERLPFDISDIRAITYDRTSLAKSLQAPLIAAVRETLTRYSISTSPTGERREPSGARSIAVTGSTNAPPDRVRDRVGRVLLPYLGKGCRWYVGTVGAVDEAVLDHLAAAGEEDVTAVGYSSFDISGRTRALLEGHPGIEFLDARSTQMPLVADAPSERDILFASRADLVVVFWNGVSQGTRSLVNWLANHNKDHVVSFVPSPYHEAADPLRR